ncbi:hypothetical protein Golob_004293 [Gossypium lobatum]|uniref:Uncharacterized protein n=1 Tax=Gossypium lobatum TaxID=34289 RepID=A0A7J8N195_9ROSI|nr:hypothetical protein [Gossypium lobatum]
MLQGCLRLNLISMKTLLTDGPPTASALKILSMGNMMGTILTLKERRKEHFGEPLLMTLKLLNLQQDSKALFHGSSSLQLLPECFSMFQGSTCS